MACDKMDGCMDLVMKVLANFSDYNIQNSNLQKGQRIVNEMEKIEEEFYLAYEAAREYLDSRRDDASSVTSDILSIDLLQRMQITDDDSETSRKETIPTPLHHTEPMVTYSKLCKNSSDSIPVTMNNLHSRQSSPVDILRSRQNSPMHVPRISDNTEYSGKPSMVQNRTEQLLTPFSISHIPPETSATSTNVHTAPKSQRYDPVSTEPVIASNEAQSLGQDLWRQLKRVEIPIFAGDKRMYRSWKSAFSACIDSAPVTGEYNPDSKDMLGPRG